MERLNKGIWEDAAISAPMARAISSWQEAFYGGADYGENGLCPSGLPAAITAHTATLVTGEMELSCGDSPRGIFIRNALEPLLEKIQLAVQLAAAFGYVAIRPGLENGRFTFSLAGPGQLFPTRFGPDGSIQAGYFVDVFGGYAKLETFDFREGTLHITNRAYRLRGEVLGAEAPLSVCPDWANLEPEVEIQGAKGPLFGLLKMPFANMADDSSPLPVSLYAGALGSIREFDRVYSELLYELHSAKRKNIVERGAIVPEGKRKSFRGLRYQDPTTDTYILDPAEEHQPFQDYSPSIRTAEYLAGLKIILHMIENQCQLSPGTMALDERTGALTATQVISQDRTTYHTCAAIQTQGLAPALRQTAQAVETLGELAGIIPQGEWGMEVRFGDGVFEDTQQEFERRMEMVKAGVMEKEEMREWYFGRK